MTQATVTWEAVGLDAGSFAMNDDAVSNLNLRYAMPRFGQVDQPRWRVDRMNLSRLNSSERMLRQRGNVSGHAYAIAAGDEMSDEWWRRFFEQLERELDEREYGKRIALLIEEAEIEAIEVNDRSLLEFWRFIGSDPRARLGYVFLTDNGDVSVEWRTGEENHFELRFLGDSRVNYVFFKRELGETHVSVGYGTEVMSTIRQRIVSSGFGQLVFT